MYQFIALSVLCSLSAIVFLPICDGGLDTGNGPLSEPSLPTGNGDALPPNDWNSCRDTGEYCTDNTQCASWLCHLGRCRSDMGDMACTNDDECIHGAFPSMVCSPRGRCTQMRMANETCTKDAQCSCEQCDKHTGRCAIRLAGEKCRRSGECDFDLYCSDITHTCVKAAPLDGACYASEHCASTNYSQVECSTVSPHRCRALFQGDLFAQCTGLYDCQANYSCDKMLNVCVALRTPDTMPEQLCTRHEDCAQGTEYCGRFYYANGTAARSRKCMAWNQPFALCKQQWQTLATCLHANRCHAWMPAFYEGSCYVQHCRSELSEVGRCANAADSLPPRCSAWMRQKFLLTYSHTEEDQQENVADDNDRYTPLANSILYGFIITLGLIFAAVGCLFAYAKYQKVRQQRIAHLVDISPNEYSRLGHTGDHASVQ